MASLRAHLRGKFRSDKHKESDGRLHPDDGEDWSSSDEKSYEILEDSISARKMSDSSQGSGEGKGCTSKVVSI